MKLSEWYIEVSLNKMSYEFVCDVEIRPQTSDWFVFDGKRDKMLNSKPAFPLQALTGRKMIIRGISYKRKDALRIEEQDTLSCEWEKMTTIILKLFLKSIKKAWSNHLLD